ncbi:hypothetical protein TYRP_011642 [Tyrophagus putrescentiae]|nr:hypothetical protein TYRP_011642 [Tyrophagus putrescentiae]
MRMKTTEVRMKKRPVQPPVGGKVEHVDVVGGHQHLGQRQQVEGTLRQENVENVRLGELLQRRGGRMEEDPEDKEGSVEDEAVGEHLLHVRLHYQLQQALFLDLALDRVNLR